MPSLFAYIDPFTGALLYQLLAMGFLAMLIFFQKVKAFTLGLFGIKKEAKSEITSEEPETFKFDEANKSDKKAA